MERFLADQKAHPRNRTKDHSRKWVDFLRLGYNHQDPASKIPPNAVGGLLSLRLDVAESNAHTLCPVAGLIQALASFHKDLVAQRCQFNLAVSIQDYRLPAKVFGVLSVQ